MKILRSFNTAHEAVRWMNANRIEGTYIEMTPTLKSVGYRGSSLSNGNYHVVLKSEDTSDAEDKQAATVNAKDADNSPLPTDPPKPTDDTPFRFSDNPEIHEKLLGISEGHSALREGLRTKFFPGGPGSYEPNPDDVDEDGNDRHSDMFMTLLGHLGRSEDAQVLDVLQNAGLTPEESAAHLAAYKEKHYPGRGDVRKDPSRWRHIRESHNEKTGLRTPLHAERIGGVNFDAGKSIDRETLKSIVESVVSKVLKNY
jgi:hypothetical protein